MNKHLKTTDLETEIARLHTHLTKHEPDTEVYALIATRLGELHALKEAEKPKKNRVSADTIVIAAVNIIGIVTVLGYEHAHPIVSKAFSMPLKPKF